MIKHNKCIDLVFDIIKKYATEDEPIDQADILRKLEEDPENACDRRTVARALKSLMEKYGKDDEGDWIDENIRLHYVLIPRGDSPIPKDFWMEFCYEDDFTDEELMFLMDAVQFSKHVDKTSAEEITRKLVKLSHNRYSGIFEIHSKINEKNVPIKKDFFLINGDIIGVEEDYFLPWEKGIIKKFENASDDTLFPIINLLGENFYVPKKSIVYISTGAVEVRE